MQLSEALCVLIRVSVGQSLKQEIDVVYRRDHSDFDELHTHLHKVSELYRSVLSGKVLSHNMGVTLNFGGATAQGRPRISKKDMDR